MNNYWLSWIHEDKFGAFELHYPWWCSGYDSKDNPTMCAAVKAKDKHGAREIILGCYDYLPDDLEFRFVEQQENHWTPFSDRFPKADWMKWDESGVQSSEIRF